ncbi:MAG TPA: hypothetical protein VMC62_07490 [Longilinea sp.]|nr:hypothetical protein [Longilinea sp.]
MAANILLIGGSLNQTTMMHKIGQQLPEHHCYYSPFYGDGSVGWMSSKGLLNFSILGGKHRRNTVAYFKKNNLPMDFGGKERSYDLVITCADLIVPENIKKSPLLLVQEGMTEPEGLRYQLVKYLKFPRFIANTAATGLSDAYDIFCVASEGYRDLFVSKGVRSEKIHVTGIPNFDNVQSYTNNPFPYRHYVLAATSSIRETFGVDLRIPFILQAKQVAAGRQLIFKLHPNENIKRATREIKLYAPEALILTDGDTNHMVANCDVLLTQYSSIVYVGIALGKEVYSYFDVNQLKKLVPLQNGGKSAESIANLSRELLAGRMRWKKDIARVPENPLRKLLPGLFQDRLF